MKLEIYEHSKNYTCQVIKLPVKKSIPSLDNLVEVVHQGNSCLVGKDSDPNELYLFFPVECQISDEFLANNNLFRHSEKNKDTTKTGFFEDSGRVKAIKFKGIISSGFIIPESALWRSFDPSCTFSYNHKSEVGDEFNIIDGKEICKKYKKPANTPGAPGSKDKNGRIIDEIVNSRMAPEHPDTSQLMKNIHKLNLEDVIAVTYKLHGTSARYYNTLVKRKLSLLERVSRFFGAKIQEEEYKFVCASRRVIKSVAGEEVNNKKHYYSEDLWTKVGKNLLEDKLNEGEAIYCEIIGKDYTGKEIQGGYSYGFNEPKVYIYRISNINSQGIEVDLSYQQMKLRAEQLGIEVCPELFYGKLEDFIEKLGKIPRNLTTNDYPVDKEYLLPQYIEDSFKILLEVPSILDKSVVEEGFILRKDTCNKPEMFKIKSKKFLLHESKVLDKINEPDLESVN